LRRDRWHLHEDSTFSTTKSYNDDSDKDDDDGQGSGSFSGGTVVILEVVGVLAEHIAFGQL